MKSLVALGLAVLVGTPAPPSSPLPTASENPAPQDAQSQAAGHGTATAPAQHEHPANHLAGQTSPYLLQHLHNPVDWYPWGPQALERARKESKPIFLSIGYSACHWCHVMERETFENEELAALMNQWFVCIKVDREERPDLDELYMNAVQKMTGRGGWPMSVFLTPDLKPFFGGTYFPPYDSGRGVGFKRVLEHVHTLWGEQREAVEEAGEKLVAALRAESERRRSTQPVSLAISDAGLAMSERHYDEEQGGFGSPPAYAPKFPHVTELVFLLRYSARTGSVKALGIVEHTLRAMAAGGIYDQLAGGFARYSTDRTWTAPHFEKMLYDNSQLAALYMEAFQATGDQFYERISRETLDYILREMTSPEGGFYSTTDADSEGEEGKFFVWSREEVRAVCGADAEVAEHSWGITQQGNFEGHNILTARTIPAEVAVRTKRTVQEVGQALERARTKLYAQRETRIHPLLDDKVLSSWNGLMLSAFARAAAVFGEERYLQAAQANGAFLLSAMRDEHGRLYRTRRNGHSHLAGYLEDYAFVTAGLIDLFEADPDPRWIKGALELHGMTEKHFADPLSGAWFSVADDGERLPVRTNSAQESSLPSDIGVAAMNAARLGLLAGDSAMVERARDALASHAAELARYPVGFSQLLLVLEFLESRPPEVFVAGEDGEGSHAVADYLHAARTQWPPHRVLCALPAEGSKSLEQLLPAAAGKRAQDGVPAAFVCHEGVCEKPLLLGREPEISDDGEAGNHEHCEVGHTEDEEEPPAASASARPRSASYSITQGYDPLGPDFFPPPDPKASQTVLEAALEAGLLYHLNGPPADPGPAAEGVLRVVLWGDELVSGGGLGAALQAALQKRRGGAQGPAVEVISRGERGYGADQAVLSMEEELAILRPTVAVLVLNGHNDLGDNLRNRIFRVDEHNNLERNAWSLAGELADLLLDRPEQSGAGQAESATPADTPPIAALIAAAQAEHYAWDKGDNSVRPFLNDPWDADAACSGGAASVTAKQILLDRLVGRAQRLAADLKLPLASCVVPSVIDLEDQRATDLGAKARKRYRSKRISDTLSKTCLRNQLKVANLYGPLREAAAAKGEKVPPAMLSGCEAQPWTSAGLSVAGPALADVVEPYLRAVGW